MTESSGLSSEPGPPRQPGEPISFADLLKVIRGPDYKFGSPQDPLSRKREVLTTDTANELRGVRERLPELIDQVHAPDARPDLQDEIARSAEEALQLQRELDELRGEEHTGPSGE